MVRQFSEPRCCGTVLSERLVMKFKTGINLLLLVVSCVCLAPSINAADAPAQPPNITVRDGQHYFDFNVGVWRTHIKRILDPLSGSTHSIELNGTVTVRRV